ncbi:MAG: hypothetical protein H0V81_17630 [Solirubrobacterales bacterium]|nr:hypothetical protein [Solirubrobacterales bacterium]
MKVYDEDEGYCPGDPTLEDMDLVQVKKLQRAYNRISAIKDPIKRAKSVASLQEKLNG